MFVTKTPNSKFYQIIYFVDGKRKTKSTKTTKKREAQKMLLNFFPDAPKEVKTNPNDITIKKFYEEYLQHIKLSKSKSYLRSVELSFSQLINFTADIPISSLNVRTIDSFISTAFKRAEYSSALYYRTLKAAFSKAVLWDYLESNPFKKLKAPRTPKNYPVFISVEEFKIIHSQIAEDFLKDLLSTAFFTGMRLSELTNMQWNWIDSGITIIKIKCTNQFSTKSKKERTIPINLTLHNLLQIRESNKTRTINSNTNDYVFTRSTGIKLNGDFVSKKFKKAVRAVGLNDKIHFHSLRHSFASLLVQKGVSLYVVKELLGHEDLSTTQIYSHLKTQNLVDAVNLF